MSFNEKTNKYEGYIYKATNLINGLVYIGQTTITIEKRRQGHIYNSRKYCLCFYDAIREYGIDNFNFEEIARYDADTKEELKAILNEKEIYYIDYYHSTDKKYGYNLDAGGSSNSTANHIIYQYDLQGNYVGEFDSAKNAAKILNLSEKRLCKSRNTRFGLVEVGGFYWSHIKSEHLDIIDFKGSQGRKVYQYDLQGNLVQIYNSVLEIYPEDINLRRRVYSNLCGDCKQYKGYIYRYEGDAFDLFPLPHTNKKLKLDIPIPTPMKFHGMKIDSYNVFGEKEKTYSDIYELDSEINYGISEISRHLRGGGPNIIRNHIYRFENEPFDKYVFKKPGIAQYDLNLNYIGRWKSIKECCDNYGWNINLLTQSINRHHIFNNYIFVRWGETPKIDNYLKSHAMQKHLKEKAS